MSTDRASKGPGRRAIVRWAWRMFRREWRQQLLVLVLVTLAVAAAVAGSAMVVNGATQGKGDFGNAHALVRLEAKDPALAQARLAQARLRFGELEVIGHQSVAVPGSAEPLDLRSQTPGGALGGPLLALRHGRYPTAPGEVALTADAATRLVTHLGGTVTLAGTKRTVVGLIENPNDLGDDFGLVAPADAAPDTLTLLLQSAGGPPPGATATASGTAASRDEGPGFMVEGASNDSTAIAATVLIVTTLAMALVALIAAAGFVVVAHRRQRQLGLLAALGATERHLRLVMVANGVLVGLVASLAGGALGIAGWVLAAPAVESAIGHRLDHWALPWNLITASLLLAIAASAASAWWPARAISRLPVMAALSRRPPRPAPVHRSLLLAGGLLIGGVVAIDAAAPTSDHVRPVVLVAGVLALVVGVVLVAPAAVRSLARPAGRLPLAARLALRDLVRYQARAAASLAAITLGLGLSVAIVVLAQANQARAGEGNLSNRQLLIQVGDQRTAPDPDLAAAERQRLDDAAARVAAALGHPSMVPLDVAFNPAAPETAQGREPIGSGKPVDHGVRGVGYPYVGTPEVLAALGIDASSIKPTSELLSSLQGPLVLVDMGVRPTGPEPTTKVQHLDLPTYTSAPRSLITESAMQARGWVPARSGWLVQTTKPITAAQLAAARTAAGDVGLTVEARDAQDGLATLRTVTTAVGGLLALAIVAMTLGLLRGEAAQDLRTLTATGASARTRRNITAGTAAALALLGVVLSTAGAYAALMAAYSSELSRLVPLPLSHLVVLAVGLPLAAAAGGWLLAGREPDTFARQLTD